MRRRAFLIAALGTTMGASAVSLSGCASIKQRIARAWAPQSTTLLHASLSKPPKTTAIPTAFGAEPVWPTRIEENKNRPWPTNATIVAAHGSFLIAYDMGDIENTTLSGDRPIIVDLKGPTNYAIVPDDSEHGYRIEQMTPPPITGVIEENRVAPSPGTLVTEQFISAGVCDDEFAYLITGTEVVRIGQPPENRGRMSLLKIRLADRSIVASTLLGEGLALKAKEATYRAGSSISLTPDGASLLVTSSIPHRALKLSAADLSVQLDLASTTSQNFGAVDGGEAVALLSDDDRTQTAVVTLADGVTHPLENTNAWIVHQGYLYAVGSRTSDRPGSERIINLATGEQVELEEMPDDYVEHKQATVSASNGVMIRKSDYIQVRRNGSATAVLSRKSTEKETYRSAAIYGSVLYLTLNGGRLRLVDLNTGKVIQESKTSNPNEMVTVTPYGFCNEINFYPATAWQS